MDLTERVIAMLILLYAQPLNRITRLTLDDITVDEHGQMLIRLGDPPAPVPAPFDAIVNDYLAARPNLTTATNPNSDWLFPGRRAGQPLHPTSIRRRLSTLGIPNLPGRSRALREMLLQAPPPSSPACSATPRQSRSHRRRSRRHLEALRPWRPHQAPAAHPAVLIHTLSAADEFLSRGRHFLSRSTHQALKRSAGTCCRWTPERSKEVKSNRSSDGRSAISMIVFLLTVTLAGSILLKLYERVAPTMKKKHRIWLFAMLLGLAVALSIAVATGDVSVLRLDYIHPMSRSPGRS